MISSSPESTTVTVVTAAAVRHFGVTQTRVSTPSAEDALILNLRAAKSQTVDPHFCAPPCWARGVADPRPHCAESEGERTANADDFGPALLKDGDVCGACSDAPLRSDARHLRERRSVDKVRIGRHGLPSEPARVPSVRPEAKAIHGDRNSARRHAFRCWGGGCCPHRVNAERTDGRSAWDHRLSSCGHVEDGGPGQDRQGDIGPPLVLPPHWHDAAQVRRRADSGRHQHCRRVERLERALVVGSRGVEPIPCDNQRGPAVCRRALVARPCSTSNCACPPLPVYTTSTPSLNSVKSARVALAGHAGKGHRATVDVTTAAVTVSVYTPTASNVQVYVLAASKPSPERTKSGESPRASPCVRSRADQELMKPAMPAAFVGLVVEPRTPLAETAMPLSTRKSRSAAIGEELDHEELVRTRSEVELGVDGADSTVARSARLRVPGDSSTKLYCAVTSNPAPTIVTVRPPSVTRLDVALIFQLVTNANKSSSPCVDATRLRTVTFSPLLCGRASLPQSPRALRLKLVSTLTFEPNDGTVSEPPTVTYSLPIRKAKADATASPSTSMPLCIACETPFVSVVEPTSLSKSTSANRSSAPGNPSTAEPPTEHAPVDRRRIEPGSRQGHCRASCCRTRGRRNRCVQVSCEAELSSGVVVRLFYPLAVRARVRHTRWAPAVPGRTLGSEAQVALCVSEREVDVSVSDRPHRHHTLPDHIDLRQLRHKRPLRCGTHAGEDRPASHPCAGPIVEPEPADLKLVPARGQALPRAVKPVPQAEKLKRGVRAVAVWSQKDVRLNDRLDRTAVGPNEGKRRGVRRQLPLRDHTRDVGGRQDVRTARERARWLRQDLAQRRMGPLALELLAVDFSVLVPQRSNKQVQVGFAPLCCYQRVALTRGALRRRLPAEHQPASPDFHKRVFEVALTELPAPHASARRPGCVLRPEVDARLSHNHHAPRLAAG
eukprot:3136587-Rhodomonas_salina.2